MSNSQLYVSMARILKLFRNTPDPVDCTKHGIPKVEKAYSELIDQNCITGAINAAYYQRHPRKDDCLNSRIREYTNLSIFAVPGTRVNSC